MRIFILVIFVSFISGCSEEKETVHKLQVIEYTTVGLGPATYRQETIKKLQNAGIPVLVGEPDQRDVADISWPKKNDELAYSIYIA